MRTTAMNAFDIGFLAESDGSLLLDRLRDPARAKLPPVESFKSGIDEADLDLEMASGKEKQDLEERRRGFVWQALRVGSRERFRAFDKVEDGRNIGALFEPAEVRGEEENGEKEEDKEGSGDGMETEAMPLVEREGKGNGEGEMDTLMFDARTPGDGRSDDGGAFAATNGEQQQQNALDGAAMVVSTQETKSSQTSSATVI